MDADIALDILRRETGVLAVAARPALRRAVPRYPGWTVADLVVHTGRIHRWVAEIVRTGATERIAHPDVAPPPGAAPLTAWLMAGAADLAATLEDVAPSTRVWTFAGDGTAGFWRRRMALETTIHRWDAQSAAGAPAPIPREVALDGVTEALTVYLGPRLAGAAVGGAGQRVALHCTDSHRTWSLRLLPEGVDIDDDGQAAADVTVEGTAEDLWRYLMGRHRLDDLRVTGDRAAALLCSAAIDMVPAPQR